jgi:hypothetical protein
MEKAMKRLLGVVLLACALAYPARADEQPSAETMQAAQELAGIVTGDTVKQLSTALAAQVWPTIEAQAAGKVDATTLAEMRQAFEQTLAKFTGEVMAKAPEIYAHHFTAQELRDMVAFYKSPVGIKALREMPKVMLDVSQQMAPRLKTLQTELNAQMIAIMQKHGYKKHAR